MVSEYISQVYSCDKTYLLVSRSRLFVEVKVKYHGHIFQEMAVTLTQTVSQTHLILPFQREMYHLSHVLGMVSANVFDTKKDNNFLANRSMLFIKVKKPHLKPASNSHTSPCWSNEYFLIFSLIIFTEYCCNQG